MDVAETVLNHIFFLHGSLESLARERSGRCRVLLLLLSLRVVLLSFFNHVWLLELSIRNYIGIDRIRK
jgi:hypothetical protein